MSCKRVFLVGFMCSGKTTVGRLLASRLGWDFLDVDHELEKAEGISIPEIFELKGEEYFRRRELEILMGLAEGERLVVSTGGGLGADPQAMRFMKSSGLVVWLSIDFEGFLKRCGDDPSRPLLKRGREELIRLFEKRSENYRQAHLLLEASMEPSLLVERILHACKNHPHAL